MIFKYIIVMLAAIIQLCANSVLIMKIENENVLAGSILILAVVWLILASFAIMRAVGAKKVDTLKFFKPKDLRTSEQKLRDARHGAEVL